MVILVLSLLLLGIGATIIMVLLIGGRLKLRWDIAELSIMITGLHLLEIVLSWILIPTKDISRLSLFLNKASTLSSFLSRLSKESAMRRTILTVLPALPEIDSTQLWPGSVMTCSAKLDTSTKNIVNILTVFIPVLTNLSKIFVMMRKLFLTNMTIFLMPILINMGALMKMISRMITSLALISSTGQGTSNQLAGKLLLATMIKATLITFKFLPLLISKVNSPCQESETESIGKVFLINVEEHTSKSSQPATADLTTTLYHYPSIIFSISSSIVC